MKKLYIFWALCLMSAMSISAFAQEKKLTVNDGAAATSVMTPIALKYCDNWTESQHIIPASLLTEMAGGQILGLQYYTSATSAFTSKATIELVMWEVSASTTTLNGFLNYGQPNAVYTGKVQFVKEDGTVRANIFFDTPFAYQGGSIVIDAKNTSPLWTNDVIYYGQTVEGASWAGYNSETAYITGTQQNFAPKTTFYYEKEDEPVDEREALTYFRLAGFDNSGIKAGVTWTESLCKSIANAIQPDGNAPWHINADWAYLMVYNEDTNVEDGVEFGTQLEGGKYYYRVEIAINDGLTDTYRIPDWGEEDIIVVVDGESWDVTARNATYGSFEIESPEFQVLGQGIENTSANFGGSHKVIRNGLLLIERNGKTYNAIGAEIR